MYVELVDWSVFWW